MKLPLLATSLALLHGLGSAAPAPAAVTVMHTRRDDPGSIGTDGTRVTGVEPEGTRVTKRNPAAGDSVAPDGTRVTGVEPDGTRVTRRNADVGDDDSVVPDGTRVTGAESNGTRVTKRNARKRGWEPYGWEPYGADADDGTDGTRVTRRDGV